VQQFPAPFEYHPTLRGGHDAGQIAVEQLQVEVALEILDAAGQRGLTDVQSLAGAHECGLLRQHDGVM